MHHLALDKTVSIAGTLLMLDDTTPHVAVPVQAIRDGKVIATTLSDEHGDYHILNWMKSWLKIERVKEMIIVMPNSHNKLRGSFYTNSAATGNWADFIAEDLVKHIDNHYRTLPQRESRAGF
jgi:enterochelin esterase-like enzyme